jgi:RNA polymerase sigma factor (sigma-70 family)
MSHALESLPDAQLLQLCKDGQQRAWEVLVRRYQRLIYTIPRRAGLDESHAADVFQTTFVRLFENLDRMHDPSRLRAWLVTTARRETLHLLAMARRVVEVAPLRDDGGANDPLDQFADPSPLPEELLSSLQDQDRLRRAVDRLDDPSRALMAMLFLCDEPMPYREIAARLQIAEGSIGPTRARALARLRVLLQEP